MADDPFDEILNLENEFYDQGYKEGLEDGIKAGRTEGRIFGLEKGYEKFFAAGRLYSRAVVWANRLAEPAELAAGQEASTAQPQTVQRLPALPRSAKLAKNVKAVYELLEPDTLPTENADESVADFDYRLKRAQTKARLIERAIGERDRDERDESDGPNVNAKNASIEDINIPPRSGGSSANA